MKPRIVNLAIKGFRAFRELNIEGLGRVNLITGRNNTGKSSLLEALRILATDSSESVLQEILSSREEDGDDLEETSGLSRRETRFQLSCLFHGYPNLSQHIVPISIASSGGEGPMTLSYELAWFAESPRGNRVPIIDKIPVSGKYGKENVFPLLVVKSREGRREYDVDLLKGLVQLEGDYRQVAGNRLAVDCGYVSPSGFGRTASLGPLWDRIEMTDYEKDVIDALHIVDPGIYDVGMIRRSVYVRSERFPSRIPLHSYGDGLNRLFGIIVSLVNVKGGILLIDEFENGMHHTVQTDVWRAIFRLASRLSIQVFATSHSWDAIEAFQKAASETPDEGVLIRLTRKGDNIIPTLFREDELAVVTRNRIEVR